MTQVFLLGDSLRDVLALQPHLPASFSVTALGFSSAASPIPVILLKN